MNDKFFIDSNIIIYANDSTDQKKQKKAKELILNGIQKNNITFSTQVLSEFYVIVTKKIITPLKPEIAKKQIKLLSSCEIIDIDYDLIIQAINISGKDKISYWDSLIIAAALKSKSRILYSEDLNHGQKTGSVTIINPFL